jgi:hypothetical protein
MASYLLFQAVYCRSITFIDLIEGGLQISLPYYCEPFFASLDASPLPT